MKQNGSSVSFDCGLSRGLQFLSEYVNRRISRAFRALGEVVADYPYSVIVTTGVFAIVWGCVFFAQHEVKSSRDEFTPNSAKSFDDRDYVESTYGSFSQRGRVIAVANPRGRIGNQCMERLLLRDAETARQSIQEFLRFYTLMEQIEAEYKGKVYRLDDVCVKPSANESCMVTSVLDLWNYDPIIINADDFDPLQTINGNNLTDRVGLQLPIQQYIGKTDGLDCESEEFATSNVEALAITIIYQNDRERNDASGGDPESLAWLNALADRVREFSKTSLLDVYLADRTALADEATRQAVSEAALLIGGYLLIGVFTHIALFKNSCLFCKSHLTTASLVGVCFAMLTAFGIVESLGFAFNLMIIVLPYLVLGLGIDDTFVIIGAYHDTDYRLPVKEKIAQTLERAGSSIFVTSATDCLAFLSGVLTTITGIRVFAVYAASAIMFDFVYQVTFFVAFLVLEARREERYREGAPCYGIRCSCRQETDAETGVSTVPPPPAEIAEEAAGQEMHVMNEQDDKDDENGHRLDVWKKMFGSGQYDPSATSFSNRLAGTWIPSVTLHPVGRIAVVGIEIVLIGVAIYGCTKVHMDMNYVKTFALKDSEIKKGYSMEHDYFVGDQVYFSVYTKEVETDYFYYQNELVALKAALEEDPYVIAPVSTWYESFSDWLQSDSDHRNELVDGSAPDALSFNLWLTEFLNGQGAVFSDSIVFSNETEPRIISSKIDAVTVEIGNGQQSVDMLDSIRDSIEESAPSLNPVAYAFVFLFFDGYRVIVWETTRNVILAGTAVFIVNCIVLASIRMAFIVCSMVALTDIMLFAFMWLFDLALNSVTAVTMVLAVGIAVDYSAHIAHSFLVVPGDRLARAKGALGHIGGPVMAGAFSTWIGITLLCFAEHYAYEVIFKMIFAMVMLGAWHGLIILPVVLSFIGSNALLHENNTGDKPEDA